jgi:hypothetical protein
MIDKPTRAGEYIPPAFPQSDRVTHAISIANSQGMTLRDYFAAHALQALIIREGKDHSGVINEITTTAYQYADDMLKERNE